MGYQENFPIFLTLSVILVFLTLGVYNLNTFAQENSITFKDSAIPIEFKADKVNETYVWTIENMSNPDLILSQDSKYKAVVFSIKSDQTEHELIIEPFEGGKKIAKSSEVKNGEEDELSFTTGNKQLKYYCEYHPTTMIGTIKIAE